MKKVFFTGLLFAVAFAWCHEPSARWPGMPARADPVQSTAQLPAPFRKDEFLITPLATYSVKAVVLSRDRYRFDPGAKIAPVDLALGWGSMSVASVINELHFSQSGRFYEYSWRGEAPLEPNEIVRHSANTHCLPANRQVLRRLLAVKRHELVELEGYLVDVVDANGGHWRSSLTRDDSGGGACEVLWVISVSSRRL